MDPENGPGAERRLKFDTLQRELMQRPDAASKHMARTMASFASGLFAGGDDDQLPIDNLALERAFRLPKTHQRRIHGHAHAGIRIVQRGPSLLMTLDAHAHHPDPFSASDLIPWIDALPPPSLTESLRRRQIMRMARSSKSRPRLLASLEQRYKEAIQGT